MEKLISDFDLLLEKLSRWGLIFSLLLTLGLAVLSIFLRWMGSSPLWIEPMVRHLVFLCAFLGGSLATSKNVHIKIDVLTHFMEKSSFRLLRWCHQNLISFFCLITTLLLLKASWDFYLIEKEFGNESFLSLHSSVLVGIIPFGLGLIALRFFNRFILGLIGGDAIEYRRL